MGKPGPLSRRNEYARAETLLKKAVEVSHRVQGEEHYVTLIYKNNLATVYQGQGRLDEAERSTFRFWRPAVVSWVPNTRIPLGI